MPEYLFQRSIIPRVLVGACLLLGAYQGAGAELTPGEVLILVNDNSSTSRYVARLYREYYPQIRDYQVLYLSGLDDCSGPGSTAAQEVITRSQFETHIANPVRNYLLNNDLVNVIKVIITTAGLPYRIRDTVYSQAVYPGGSSGYPADVADRVDAASVESELAVLFQIDPASPAPLSIKNRVVNPYQGYRGSSIDLFPRDILNNRANFRWRCPRTSYGVIPPIMEGLYNYYGVRDRRFGPGDIYLTCRLDGPKAQGETAVFAVRELLERSRRASSAEYGIKLGQSLVILDDAPDAGNYNYNRVFNLDYGVDYLVYNPDSPQPPDTRLKEIRDDYFHGYELMTGGDAQDGIINAGPITAVGYLFLILDRQYGHLMSQQELGPSLVVAGLSGFGVNGDEGSTSNYILNRGPGGGPLYNLSNGAVFTSIESFNGVTFFSDVTTQCVAQGKIVDFLKIGGSGAIGHSFEPLSDASVDNEFLFYNLFADVDRDRHADLTFVEAAFTAVPFLSWSETVVGDPLMRIAYGPCVHAWTRVAGDVNLDGKVDYNDLELLQNAFVSRLYSADSIEFGRYNDLCDLDRDGAVNLNDFCILDLYFTPTAP